MSYEYIDYRDDIDDAYNEAKEWAHADLLEKLEEEGITYQEYCESKDSPMFLRGLSERMF